jgi:hypothetical protein
VYKKWDDQTQEFVNEFILNTVPNGALIESALSSKSREVVVDSKPAVKSKVEKASASSLTIEDDISTTSIIDDDIDFDDDDDDFYKGLSDD